MEKQQWKEVEKVVDRALDLEPAKRGSFVRAACQPDEQLYQEAIEWLHAIREAREDNFLQD